MSKTSVNFKDYSFYFLALILIILIILTYFILKPFLVTMITAVILAFVLYPIYQKLLKYIKNKSLVAFLLSFIVILILFLPLLFMVNSVSQEAYTTYIVLKQQLLSGNLFGLDCDVSEIFLCKFENTLTKFTNEPQTKYYLESAGQKVSTWILESVSGFLFSLPIKILNFFIMIFVMFYCLKDGDLFVNWLKKVLPLDRLHQKHIFNKFNDVTFGVMYGQILVALIQGILGGIGFWIFGISSPIFWGMIMGFLALIPYLGPPVIWLPAALLKLLEGITTDQNDLVIKGTLLAIYGLVIVGSIDNILRPKLIGDRAKVHPILVLIGVLGGIKLFGLVGLIIGPVILAIMVTFFNIYVDEKGE